MHYSHLCTPPFLQSVLDGQNICYGCFSLILNISSLYFFMSSFLGLHGRADIFTPPFPSPTMALPFLSFCKIFPSHIGLFRVSSNIFRPKQPYQMRQNDSRFYNCTFRKLEGRVPTPFFQTSQEIATLTKAHT